eukprot:TRINITY_DN15558_c0_g1_i1.p1 TRINITY_DN15558_c0_g1~~TRINITY_DN15558_c0_g1_i1.p1  ORF type:complete len:251 (-),score=21.28 TRINITY_DN15558_c0_g1_i1:368-1120(-)
MSISAESTPIAGQTHESSLKSPDVAEVASAVESLKIQETSSQEQQEQHAESFVGESKGHSTFADPSDFAIKHPLQNRWTLWYDRTDGRMSQQHWTSNLKRVVTFDTVEDFWRVFNNIRPASELALGSNYHLFKENIEPSWEHVDNRIGGKWVVNAKKDKLDSMWLYAVLACIGEAFEHENEICGAVVSIRKVHRIALWTRTSTDEMAQRSIGASYKRFLELAPNETVGYQVHDDALKHNSSFKNRDRYTV